MLIIHYYAFISTGLSKMAYIYGFNNNNKNLKT